MCKRVQDLAVHILSVRVWEAKQETAERGLRYEMTLPGSHAGMGNRV